MTNPPILQALTSLPGRDRLNQQTQWHNTNCPNSAAHTNGDKHASFGWKQMKDGNVVLKCQAGCANEAIVAALGHTMADLFVPANGSDRQYFDAHAYLYQTTDGKTATKVRFDYREADGTPDKETRWEAGAHDVLWYRSEALPGPDAPSGIVYICEGEKDTDALAGVLQGTDRVAIGAPSASYEPPDEAIRALTGQMVVLWPDLDQPGHALMRRIAARLENVAMVLWVVQPDRLALPDGAGAADWVTTAGEAAVTTALDAMTKADDPGPRPTSKALIRDLADIPILPPTIPLVGLLHPTDLTVPFGMGGAGKGTLSAGLICDLLHAQHRVLIIDYEGHQNEWVARLKSLYRHRYEEDLPKGGILYIAPNSPGSGLRIGSFLDHADDLRVAAESFGCSYAFLDSVGGGACLGMDPKDDQTVTMFATGWQRLALPMAALSHITKAQMANADYPYGSVYWHNLARATMYIEQTHRTDDGYEMRVTNRKFSDAEVPDVRIATVTYSQGWLASVEIDKATAGGAAVGVTPSSQSKIVEGIVNHAPRPLSAHDIVGRWPYSPPPEVESVSARCRELVRAGSIQQAGKAGHAVLYEPYVTGVNGVTPSVSQPDKQPDKPDLGLVGS